MLAPTYKAVFWIVAGIAAAAECAVVYKQWPAPPVKICASIELGELLAAAAQADAELREARINIMRKSPDEEAAKDVMRAEAKSAAAANAVALYKQRAQEQQKAAGKGASANCS